MTIFWNIILQIKHLLMTPKILAVILPLLITVPAIAQNEPASASMKWNDWIIPINKYGNPGVPYLAENEWDNVLALEKLALSSKKEPVIYKVIYCLSTTTEMTHVKSDGSIEIQRAQMTPAQVDFCRKSFEMFKRMVFAYSGGNVKIDSVERVLDSPFKGEYNSTAFFYPSDYMDAGEGLNIEEFDGIIAHFYPGPVRTSFPSTTSKSTGWCKGLMQSSIMFDPALESGGEISILAKRTLREWCNQISALLEKAGFTGLPDVAAVKGYTLNSEEYFLHYVVGKKAWQAILSEEESEENGYENETEIDASVHPKYFNWDDIKDKPFRKLPVLDDASFEKLTGFKGSILAEGDYVFINCGDAEDITSNMLKQPDGNDSSLNNELNFLYESIAHIRFKGKDGNHHDIFLIKMDMAEPFFDFMNISSDKQDMTPRNRIIGYFLGDKKAGIVIDTIFDGIQTNELGLFKAIDGHISLEAKTIKHRIICGDKPNISFIVKNAGSEIIDTGTLTLSGFSDDKNVKIGNIYNLAAGETHNFSIDVPTENLKLGICVFNSTLNYEIGDKKFSINKPVVFDIRDAVGAVISPEHTGLISKPEFNVTVTLQNNTGERERGEIGLELPEKWKTRPSSYDFDIKGLDEICEFKFSITIGDKSSDGDYAIGAFLKIKDRKTKGPAAVCRIRKSFGTTLLKYSFDKGIEGDFAVADGLYKVSLSREKPFAGSSCLKVEDEGGSHYGHVGIFSQDTFCPDIENAEASYAFDTEDYPVIDFYLRHNLPEANLGIRVVLDDMKSGYVIMLSGEGDRLISDDEITGSISLCPIINKTIIPADGKWHRATIDLDKALDEYLGNVPHRVVKIKIGDTQERDFGWWKDSDKQTIYIDEFSIRKR